MTIIKLILRCTGINFCWHTYILFLSGIGAVGSPACVWTSPRHLHEHHSESSPGRFGSPPAAVAPVAWLTPKTAVRWPTRTVNLSLEVAPCSADVSLMFTWDRPWQGAGRSHKHTRPTWALRVPVRRKSTKIAQVHVSKRAKLSIQFFFPQRLKQSQSGWQFFCRLNLNS